MSKSKKRYFVPFILLIFAVLLVLIFHNHLNLENTKAFCEDKVLLGNSLNRIEELINAEGLKMKEFDEGADTHVVLVWDGFSFESYFCEIRFKRRIVIDKKFSVYE